MSILSIKKMLMPKRIGVAIYEYLFKEGSYELESIPNLQVIKALQSLKSKGYVKEQFAWRHYYWYLTNSGIEYLRTFLHLPPEIVPSTLKRPARTEATRPRPAALRSETSKPSEDRAVTGELPEVRVQTRRLTSAPGVGDVEFRQGFGRGRAPQ
ncbi:hypothetical protein NQ318_000646 [Aromia moschata]|uniref:Plectin/eS10 N-terminal domain-containing protein n=1 Tax=Aromia moschata TaxID=1265417 RepID=A0AAV8X7A3_9CUCU|nr:hypothetical protein NQ318_000646 [Aromia moschata]